MGKDLVDGSGSDIAVVKDRNKRKWMGDIALRLMHQKPLRPEDYSFMQTMCSSDNNSQYGEMIKAMTFAAMQHEKLNEIDDPEVVMNLIFKGISLHTNLFKASSQARRDNAVERSQNLSAFNKMARLLDKKFDESSKRGHPSSEPIDSGSVPIYVHDSAKSIPKDAFKDKDKDKGGKQ